MLLLFGDKQFPIGIICSPVSLERFLLIKFFSANDDQNDGNGRHSVHHLLATFQLSDDRQRGRQLGPAAVRVVRLPLASHVAQLLQSDHLLLHEREVPTGVPAAGGDDRAPVLLLDGRDAAEE